jgi:ribose transport system permease protein
VGGRIQQGEAQSLGRQLVQVARALARTKGSAHLRAALGSARARFWASWVAAAALYLIGGAASPGLFATSEVTAVLQVASFTGMAALGEMIVMVSGGIDLSVAGTIILANNVVAIAANGSNAALPKALLLTLSLSAACGAINGLLISYLRVNALIATLASGSAYTGAILLYTGGSPLGAVPPFLATVGQGRAWAVPYDAFVWFALTALLWLLLARTGWGRSLHALGASPVAAVVLGIRTRLVTFSAYVLSGVLAGFTGVLLAAYVASPSLTVGDEYLLGPIAAAAVGGTLLTGGVGSALGVAGGSLFITMAIVVATVLHVPSSISFVIEGAIIVISVGLYSRSITGALTRE